jgi:serine/threonine protein kinase
MADRIGQQLGNYRLLSLLGRGGFAEVYLGEHVYLKTRAAVKLLQTRLSGSEDMEGFLKEAQTVASLSHPNIVRILDFGVDGETPFLVMDYAPNGTLRQRHRRGEPVPLPTVTQYVKQVAEALQYAHDEKLVHRDVKPENMLVGRRNEVLLSDFGIALVAQSSRYQSTQDVVGTVAYMSPEQIQGKPRPASDQYSLGVAVYEWLSGVRPFSGSFTELCTQHMFATVPSLREKIPTLSSEVEQVINTALTKDPKQRFGSVQAFANALQQASLSASSPASLAPTALSQEAQPGQSQVQVEHLQPQEQKALQTPQSLIAPQPITTPPPQSITAPPIPPTQYAAPPGVNPYPYPEYAPYQMQMVSQSAVFPAYGKKENGWTLGKWQLLAMGVGTLIYFLLEFALDKLLLVGYNGLLFNPIGNLLYLPSLYDFVAGLILLVPLFCGARFGPWVGLVVALVGSLPADLFAFGGGVLAGYYWTEYLFWPLLGFLPGIAFVIAKSQTRAKSQVLIGFGVLMGFIALLSNSLLLAAVLSAVSGGGGGLNYLQSFTALFLSTIGDLFILAVALVLSERIVNSNRKRT